MATLQVRDIDNRLYESLKRLAKSKKRSISQEVIHIIESYLSNPLNYSFDATNEFLKLSGSWKDDRTAQEIIDDIKLSRKSSKRFQSKNELFN